MKKFLRTILLYIVSVAVCVLIINIMYIRIEQSEKAKITDSMKVADPYIENVPYDIEVAVFGDSHGYYGFSFEEIKEAYNCFNFSLSSQSLSYNHRILEYYKDHIREDAKVFIYISYFSFFGKPEEEETGFSDKNKRYYRFLPKEYIKDYNLKTDIYVNWFPSLNAGTYKLSRVFLRKLSTDRWSGEADRETVSDNVSQVVYNHIENRLDDEGNRIYNKEEIDALHAMIKTAQEAGATPILVSPPYLKEYIETIEQNDPKFFEEYQALIKDIVEDTGALYYDYAEDPRFSGEYKLFMDVDHLNREGARIFTDILMKEIK